MKDILVSFWNWYKKYNLSVATLLLSLQFLHLIWLTSDVVLPNLGFGDGFLGSGAPEFLIVFVDFIEIPAIITTSIVYITTFRKEKSVQSLWYLFLINTQWIHIFWITDEVVVSTLGEGVGNWNPFVAWVAIFIDYLEIPVIVENIKLFIRERVNSGLIKERFSNRAE